MMDRRDLSPPSAEIPSDIRRKYEAITALTDAFCQRHLDEEYAEMCRRLTAALARKRPTPLARGRAEVWACGIVRTIGWANMLDDPKQPPYMKLIDIDPEFGVAESTGQGKSLAIRRMFNIGRLNPDWTLPSRLGDNPVVWMVEVKGVLVDIRQESRDRQEAAFRKGLIPFIPADRTRTKDDQANKPSPGLHSLEGNLFGVVFEFRNKAMALLRAAKLDDDKLDIAAERIKSLVAKVTEDIKVARDQNVQPRLDAIFEEVKAFVDGLSQSAPASSGMQR